MLPLLYEITGKNNRNEMCDTCKENRINESTKVHPVNNHYFENGNECGFLFCTLVYATNRKVATLDYCFLLGFNKSTV